MENPFMPALQEVSMSFTPEQQQFLKELVEGNNKQITDQFNSALSGLAKRLTVDEIPKAIGAQVSPLLEKLEGLNENKLGAVVKAQFDTLLEELAKQEEAGGTEKPAEENNGAITQLQQQIEEMKKQVDAAKKIAETERKTREKLTEESRLQGLDNALLDAMRGKVKPGTERELLTLIKSANLLIEDKEANQFVTEVPDEFGLKTRKPVAEVLGDLIAQRWSHYQDVRPGTGVGAAPTSTQTASTSSNLKHFKVQEGNKLALDDAALEAAARNGKLDDILQELASATAS
jgi:hypothetical protein